MTAIRAEMPCAAFEFASIDLSHPKRKLRQEQEKSPYKLLKKLSK
jgi:hypothetical protein